MASQNQKRRAASYIGSGAADPIGWTQVAPGVAAPAGQVYVTSVGPPLRYQINPNGTYVTRAA